MLSGTRLATSSVIERTVQMDKNRGWAPGDAANDGLDSQKAEIDRLNEKSNAEQRAASKPAKTSDAPAAPADKKTD